MSVKRLTTKDTAELIKRIKAPCIHPERLMNALNNFIEQYDTIRKNGVSTNKQNKKRLDYDLKKTKSIQDNLTSELLGAYTLVESKRQELINTGLSENQIKTALLTLLTTQELLEKQTNIGITAIKYQKNNINEGSEIGYKNALIAGILPQIYSKYFNKPFSPSWSEHKNDFVGPSILFTQFVLERLNITMSGEAITKAYKRFRTGDKKKS